MLPWEAWCWPDSVEECKLDTEVLEEMNAGRVFANGQLDMQLLDGDWKNLVLTLERRSVDMFGIDPSFKHELQWLKQKGLETFEKAVQQYLLSVMPDGRKTVTLQHCLAEFIGVKDDPDHSKHQPYKCCTDTVKDQMQSAIDILVRLEKHVSPTPSEIHTKDPFMQKFMLNFRSFFVFPVPGAGGISSVPRMLTFGKAGLDLSVADIQVRMDKQQIKELDELEHLQPYKWMTTQDQTTLLEDWVANVLTQQSVTPEDQLLDMFTSMEAEQASLPTTGKAAKTPDGKK